MLGRGSTVLHLWANGRNYDSINSPIYVLLQHGAAPNLEIVSPNCTHENHINGVSITNSKVCKKNVNFP